MKPLGKSLGAPALFGIVQGFIAASVYFAVGLVAERALGFTWMVFLAGGLLFAFVVLSYVEGASLHQERGGATVIARFAFNELVSFIAGWAICLEYLILIAICAFATTDYAAVFWEPLDSGAPEFLMAAALVLFVAWWNGRGSDAPRYNRAVLIVLGDLALQLLIVAFGLIYLFEPEVLTDPASIAGTPSVEDVLFAFPLVLVAFSGLDASSGLAGQVAIGRRGLRRLISVRMLAAIVPYVGIALVASAALPDEPRSLWIEAPMLGVVDDFPQAWLREPLRYIVAASAVAILAAACNAAMLGVSRLGYSLALNRQIPSRIGYLHPNTATPVVIIGIGTLRRDRCCCSPPTSSSCSRSRRSAPPRRSRSCACRSAACGGASPTATGRTRCRSTCACGAPTCRCRRRSAPCCRAPRSWPCSRSTRARAGSASAGWRSACCSTSTTGCRRTSRC